MLLRPVNIMVAAPRGPLVALDHCSVCIGKLQLPSASSTSFVRLVIKCLCGAQVEKDVALSANISIHVGDHDTTNIIRPSSGESRADYPGTHARADTGGMSSLVRAQLTKSRSIACDKIENDTKQISPSSAYFGRGACARQPTSDRRKEANIDCIR